MNPTTPGERIARLEERMDATEKTIDELSIVAETMKTYVSVSKGEAQERDKQHKENRWRANLTIALLTALIPLIISTAVYLHNEDEKREQRLIRYAAPSGHSDLPQGYDPEARN